HRGLQHPRLQRRDHRSLHQGLGPGIPPDGRRNAQGQCSYAGARTNDPSRFQTADLTDRREKRMLELTGRKVVLREFTAEHLNDPKYFAWLRDLETVLPIYR